MERLRVQEIKGIEGNIATVGRAMGLLDSAMTPVSDGKARIVLSDGVGVCITEELAVEMAEPRAAVLRVLAGLLLEHPNNAESLKPDLDRCIPRFGSNEEVGAFLGRIGEEEGRLSDAQIGEVAEEFWRQLNAVDSNLVRELVEGDTVKAVELVGLLADFAVPRRGEDAPMTESVPVLPHIDGLDTGAAAPLTGEVLSVEETGALGASMVEGRRGHGETTKIEIPVAGDEGGESRVPGATDVPPDRRTFLDIEPVEGLPAADRTADVGTFGTLEEDGEEETDDPA